jgi:hypothetical protein
MSTIGTNGPYLKIMPIGHGYFEVLVNGGANGQYDTLKGAKAGARRFIHSTEGVDWAESDLVPGVWIGNVRRKRGGKQ